MGHANKQFESLGVAVLTVSDTRDRSTDTSGEYLAVNATESGHQVIKREIVIDDIYLIRACVSAYIADPAIQAVIVTGGTGFTARDSTPEAVKPLFDKEVEGFGELFRYLSFKEIGTSTIQSRAISGLANNTVIFCLPGSTNACKTAWAGIIEAQLNGAHGPCNFVPHLQTNEALQCASRPI
ncbi:molybdenum cofactor biosynthesis protein B [Alteromonas facilis]|uniref:molybdenum cofactor biosynthesis protein B n=1 Tax=Alteromonas facilis TaxID=2048004 RepID=UPI000C294F07|nr:molybdenum cofactor biosynthesis protein B [Alteromonas facilis]